MPGTGTVRILQDTEMRNRLSAYSHLVWNILVHHAKTWLPYGVILACLTGIWFWWDGPASDQNVVVRETKNHTDSPPPSFLHKKAGPPSKGEGRCIHSLAGIRRTKPLADLFESPVAMETAGKEAKKEDNPEQKEKQNGREKERLSRPVPLPQVLGVLEEGGRRLILLSNGLRSQACAAGESFDSWQIAYISHGVAGLSKEGVIHEVYF